MGSRNRFSGRIPACAVFFSRLSLNTVFENTPLSKGSRAFCEHVEMETSPLWGGQSSPKKQFFYFRLVANVAWLQILDLSLIPRALRLRVFRLNYADGAYAS